MTITPRVAARLAMTTIVALCYVIWLNMTSRNWFYTWIESEILVIHSMLQIVFDSANTSTTTIPSRKS